MTKAKKKPATKKKQKVVPLEESFEPQAHQLSEFESRFCQEYIIDLNATQAFIRAGSKANPNSAGVEASKLLGKPKIQAQVEHLADERSKRTQLDGDKVLGDLNSISSSDIRALYDEKGCILQPHQWPDDIAMAVKEIQVDELKEWNPDTKTMDFIGYTKKIKFWDKIKTRELIGKHLKLFTEKVEHSGSVSLEQLVGGSIKKDT